jgi:LPXTG-site transpeptidase (sortase) family protein
MPERARIGLDNAVFSGRLRGGTTVAPMPRSQPYRGPMVQSSVRPKVRVSPQPAVQQAAIPQPIAFTKPQPQPESYSNTSSSQPLEQNITRERFRQPQVEALTPQLLVTTPPSTALSVQDQPRGVALFRLKSYLTRLVNGYTKPQMALVGMAGFLFIIGVAASLQTLMTNQAATAQVSALSKTATDQPAISDAAAAGSSHANAPSTVKPSPKAYGSYAVTADLARYIKIPKIGASGRVLQVGINNDGSLGTPNNVYDAAWYTGSAKPGQPGATLIDGHVSSWTSHGIFYGLKKLVAGDTIQIQRGDGQLLTYRVVRSQVYNADNVDMQAAITPVTKGKSGLNLITCTGKVKPGTSEFNERVIVFSEQI